jgi:hypothetical protein
MFGSSRISSVGRRGGTRRLTESWAYLWLTISALFFDPNPMQLQSACSKEVSRDSFAT